MWPGDERPLRFGLVDVVVLAALAGLVGWIVWRWSLRWRFLRALTRAPPGRMQAH